MGHHKEEAKKKNKKKNAKKVIKNGNSKKVAGHEDDYLDISTPEILKLFTGVGIPEVETKKEETDDIEIVIEGQTPVAKRTRGKKNRK